MTIHATNNIFKNKKAVVKRILGYFTLYKDKDLYLS